jgi:hypothetical protein
MIPKGSDQRAIPGKKGRGSQYQNKDKRINHHEEI